MKRAALVSYSSSEEEDEPVPAKKKMKLPALSSALKVPAPVDNPALHQGRTRSSPYVEGQFAAHVYICLSLDRKSSLYKLLQDVLSSAKTQVPALHDFWSQEGIPNASLKNPELHVSLSRPVFVRAHQREELKRAVKGLANKHRPFQASFTTFTELINDERTRTFLTVEVGAGHHELKLLAEALTPTIQGFRQKEYYSEPRFHASLAWALLDRPSDSPEKDQEFLTIARLPETLIEDLNKKHGSGLSSRSVGVFEVEEVTVKIGKEVSAWRLRGE